MRLQRPQLPTPDPKDKFSNDLVFKVKQILTNIIDQLNGISEGQVQPVTNATTAPPTTGTAQLGDFVRNSAPTVLGTAGSRYVVTGFLCVAAGSPGTWVQTRSLTGT
jgi:hypothetical protein